MDCIKCNEKLKCKSPYSFYVNCDECFISYELDDEYELYIIAITYKNKIGIRNKSINNFGLLNEDTLIYCIDKILFLKERKFNSYEEILEYLTNLYDNLIFE